jgi:hypothetical protein
MSAETLSRGKR